MNTLRLLALSLLLGSALTACSNPPESDTAPATDAPSATAPAEVASTVPSLMSAADFVATRVPGSVVLDVRTPAEYASGHLSDAVLMDVQQPDFEAKIADLDPSQTVYVYCRSGNRSERAAGILRAKGFTNVSNIGGFDDLARAGAAVAQ